jgi:hypothetical protein
MAAICDVYNGDRDWQFTTLGNDTSPPEAVPIVFAKWSWWRAALGVVQEPDRDAADHEEAAPANLRARCPKSICLAAAAIVHRTRALMQHRDQRHSQ